ncbi:general secretion pathway protein D [Trinickia symbiotica]|uniref:General secretion pathway protein GspD n=1 Tax=Trinickia symbiotica TaxID=863227 RepID=A0A2N7X1W9_9BURK|nr:type IV pilus secretin PilQ [Trinickia symbiotica]PMS35600.1 general secretion pathway protein GspD [Trinickia symbiotica]PPK47664.1 general secretion pathway protein D [Trinickia symbiotica]
MKPSSRRGVAREADRCHLPRDLKFAPLACGVAWAVVLSLVGGCATNIDDLRTASKREPTNAKAQLKYLDERDHEVTALLDEADQLRVRHDYGAAIQKLQEAWKLDPTSERGKRIGSAIELDRRDDFILSEVDRMVKRGSLDSAAQRLDQVLAENPNNVAALRLYRELAEKRRQARLAADEQNASTSIMKKPVSLQFRDANVRMVFEALSRTTGLNVIFDRDVRADLKTTIFVSNASLDDTVDMILMQNQLEKKVLNANTVFIYPATPAKEQEYEDLKVRTFQLSNTDAKQIQTLLKSLLKIKEVVVDERANTVTIRATPETIRVAERMIAAQDIPDPEVMLEVKVLEVSRDRLTDLGIDWPNSFSASTPNSVQTWADLHHLPVNALAVSGLSATANFKLTDTDANLLASPRIRTRNKEKAKILIGDKVPVISSSSVPSTSGPAYSQSIQYLDVGIKLEVEPQVYRDNDVGMKLNLEVSNITNTISSSNSQSGLSSLAYQIGTRSASTSLRMKDGETQILGGLIQDEDRDAADKVPGLGQLPVLGRLFSNHNGDHKKTEIVLMITPHIIRPQLAADADTREMWSGTDEKVRTEQLRLDPPSVDTASALPALPAPAPATASGAVPVAAVGSAEVVAVTPGHVGGGNALPGADKAGAATSGAATVPVTGALGVPPATPRTTAPPTMFGGRFMTSVPLPATAVGGGVGSAGAAAGGTAVGGAAAGGATANGAAADHAQAAGAGGAGGSAPTADTAAAHESTGAATAGQQSSTAPAPQAAASTAPSPPPIMPAQPSDMASDNPLHAIPVDSN